MNTDFTLTIDGEPVASDFRPVVINPAAGPLVSALYIGNTVVRKPSPYTRLCTLKMGELAREIFPRGAR